MDLRLKNYCNYLRDVLTFRDYIEIPENRDDYFMISDEELKAGVLTETDHIKKTVLRWGVKDIDLKKELDVILIPKVVSDIILDFTTPRVKREGQVLDYKVVSLLYIKAKLIKTKDGYKIKAKEGESLVWSDTITDNVRGKLEDMFRDLLNRVLGREAHRDYPKFRLRAGAPLHCSSDSWKQYINAVDRHYMTRTGKGLFVSDTLIDEVGKSHDLYMEGAKGQITVMRDNTVFAAGNIVNLLAYIDEMRGSCPPLLKTMILGGTGDKRTYTHKAGEEVEKHLGQMKNKFFLADAQREAVHCFSTRIKDGDVLAVSGPPGTGKTTMLQSIVADMVVNYAVNKLNNPDKAEAPLILACSSNNKAITNIIDAFKVEDDYTEEANLHQRWIYYETKNNRKKFASMAVYCPSSAASKRNVEDYFLTDRNGGMDYQSLREKYQNRKNVSDFENRANKALWPDKRSSIEDIISLEDIMKALRKQIKYLKRELSEIGKMIRKKATTCEALIRIAERYEFSSEEIWKRPESEYAKAIDQILDKTLRFDLYWYAVHYNECVWIKKINERPDKSSSKVEGEELWKEIKYICPCVVSTFYMAPKLFEFKQKGYKSEYYCGLADLLIVDEAGQVSPEIGLPTFALAKKALVVGDVKQIPPVYSISEVVEDRYWWKRICLYLLKKDRQLLSCCSSSIMAIAESRCKYDRITRSGERMPGLFLNEHRRCIDGIIEYSNELIYNDELVPKRGSHTDDWPINDIHPIAFHHTEGRSEQKDGSRYNSVELEAISTWLKQNAGRIEAAYNEKEKEKKKIEELVCIITPFKAQAMLLKADSELSKFQSGTVHTFQGAECPIVIFSLVYGAYDNPTFIKNNHELMNVAVSRAKDHFIIFGDWRCIETQTDKACRLLYKKAKPIK